MSTPTTATSATTPTPDSAAGDRKGIAALLVSKMKPKDGDGPEVNDNTKDDSGGGYEGKMACAEEMMTAIDEKDPESFLKALDNYLAHR